MNFQDNAFALVPFSSSAKTSLPILWQGGFLFYIEETGYKRYVIFLRWKDCEGFTEKDEHRTSNVQHRMMNERQKQVQEVHSKLDSIFRGNPVQDECNL